MREAILAGFENYTLYEDGRVKNNKTNRFLVTRINKQTGYKEVSFPDKKTKKRIYKLVHRLLGFYFLDGYQEGFVINHKNGIRSDNRLENLEWVTQSQNLKDAFIKGRRKDDVSAKAVVGTNMETGEKIYFSSIWKAARTLNISQGNICLCCKNQRPYANGYYWAYDNEKLREGE